jgi:hypothetical protein
MATIIKDGMTLKVGRDFVDAVTMDAPASHGRIQVNGKSMFDWVSSLAIVDAERILRKAASEDHARVTLFVSQAL